MRAVFWGVESFSQPVLDAMHKHITEADALIVLDTSNRQRVGRLAPLLDRFAIPVAVVDHHVSHARGFGQVNLIEPEASATGEILTTELPITGWPANESHAAVASCPMYRW